MAQKTTDYKRKFNEEKYDRLYPYVSKGRKAEIQAAAEAEGESLNDFIVKAIDERMERIQRKRDASMPFAAPPGDECPTNCKKRCTMIPPKEDGKPVVEIPLCTLYGKEIADNKKCEECLQNTKNMPAE